MAANSAEDKKVGLSFGFSKKHEVRQLSKSVAGEALDKEDKETDYVLSLEGKEVKSTKESGKPKQQEYVIPLIKQNKWRTKDNFGDSNIETQSGSPNTLDELAAKELLQDAARYNDDWEERGKEDSTVAIPLLMQNKIPAGFESDEKLDVTLRPGEPDDADYEQIPIEHFGMAMLRGMGWNETRGIGKNGQVIAPVEAHLRPKGLGLGADRSNTGSDKKKKLTDNDNAEELELKKCSLCVVSGGVHKDLYGTVEGIDEDNARVMLKLALSGKVVNIMQCNVCVVSKKEFDKYSKYLNKQKADKYKEDEQKKLENGSAHQNGREDYDKVKKKKSHKRSKSNVGNSDSDNESDYNKHKSKKHKKHSKSKDYDSHEEKYAKKRKKSDHDSKSSKSKYPKSSEGSYKDRSDSESEDECVDSKSVLPWLRSDLRVRIIDKDLKKGKYYKEKVIIVDVPSPGTCVCKTSDDKLVENVSQSSLETVIPKTDSSYVAIVAGSSRGQIGKLMKRDKEKCLALVQLLSDRDKVLKLQYDDICEFVGEIQFHEDY